MLVYKTIYIKPYTQTKTGILDSHFLLVSGDDTRLMIFINTLYNNFGISIIFKGY